MGGSGTKIERRNALMTSPLNQPGVLGTYGLPSNFPSAPVMSGGACGPMGAPMMGSPFMGAPLMGAPLMGGAQMMTLSPFSAPLQAAPFGAAPLGMPLGAGSFGAAGLGTPMAMGANAFGAPLGVGGLSGSFASPYNTTFGATYGTPMGTALSAPPMTMAGPSSLPPTVQFIPLNQLQSGHQQHHHHHHPQQQSSFEMTANTEYLIPQQGENASQRRSKPYNYSNIPRSA